MGIYNLNDRLPFAMYEGARDPKAARVIERISSEIIAGNCFAFVGAGVSMRSGLPGWVDFINHMAEQFSDGTEAQPLIRKYVDRGDLITAAELIKRANPLRDDFNRVAAAFFQQVHSKRVSTKIAPGRPIPNDIHRFLTRTAFQKLVTTNYDDLLNEATKESSIINHFHLTRNEQNFETRDLVTQLISGDSAIVKIHGTCTAPGSMIITRQDYLNAYSGGYLINWLRTNLIQKSFLFIGYSLSDFDIINLIKEARATLPKNVSFGRHFAILDASGTNEIHRDYLRECYNIETIVDNIQDENREVLRDIFSHIHGKSALAISKKEAFTAQPPYALQTTLQEICRSIRVTVGVDYLSLYLTDDIDQIYLSAAGRWLGAQQELEVFPYKRSYGGSGVIPPTDELKRTFLSMRDNNYYYSGHIDRKDMSRFGLPDLAGRNLKSLIIMPVASQGKKIGLLVVSSVIENAFTAEHYKALAIHARAIAESYKALLRKLNTVRSSQESITYEEALSKVTQSRLLNSLVKQDAFEFIFYAVDYEKSMLIPKIPTKSTSIDTKTWKPLHINETYLATEAALSGATLHFKDREEAIQYMRDHPKVKAGLDFFAVKGNLYITPIRSNGYISTILVCWMNSATRKRFTPFERAKRIVRILFNNYKDETHLKPAFSFLDRLDKNMAAHDGGDSQVWKNVLTNPDDPIHEKLVYAVLAALVADSGSSQEADQETYMGTDQEKNSSITGLTRVRLWVRVSPADIGALEEERDRISVAPDSASTKILFKLMYFDAYPKALSGNVEAAAKRYIGITSGAEDEYTRNTLDRYATDPYAREINPYSDGIRRPDKNADALEKDPNGSWLTVPLVYRCRTTGQLWLLGFISADDHRHIVIDKKRKMSGYIKPTKRANTAAAQLAFQRCALDLAAHLVAPLIKEKFFPSDTEAVNGPIC